MSTAAEASVPAARNTRALRAPGLAAVGLAMLAIFVAVAAAAPAVMPHGVHELSGAPLEPPSSDHLLGTNAVGQDVFSQLVAGTRVSLLVALLAGGGALVLGATIGMISGWLGGRTDAFLMRVVDLFLVVPRLPLLIVVVAYAGTSLWSVAAIIALTSWPVGARVVRSQTLSLRPRAYLRAATCFGARTPYVLRQHLAPELGLILAAGLVVAAERAIVLEAGLAFLGLGDPLRTSWGSIMRDALDFQSLFFTDAWKWWLLPPVGALALLLLALTLVGVSLEERVNPRLARHARGRGR